METDEDDLIEALDFGNLDITAQDDILDETAGKPTGMKVEKPVIYSDSFTGHIQENLEDELVQEALKKVCV